MTIWDLLGAIAFFLVVNGVVVGGFLFLLSRIAGCTMEELFEDRTKGDNDG